MTAKKPLSSLAFFPHIFCIRSEGVAALQLDGSREDGSYCCFCLFSYDIVILRYPRLTSPPGKSSLLLLAEK